MFCEPRKRKTLGPKIIGHTHQRSYGDHTPQSRFSAIDSAARPQYRQVVADCEKLITFVMRYAVLHAFLTYRVYKRLYLSALNLVNFLKTPYTTAPERVRVVFRCRRFTRTQSSRNSALPFLFCTNEPHLSALLPMQSNPMRRQDTFPVTGFFIQKESCVTFFPAAVLFLPAPAAPASGRKTIPPPAT